jgi:hypothetical protein
MKYIKIFEEFNNIETATAGAGGRGPGGSGPSRSGGGQAAVAMASATGGSPPPPPPNNNDNDNDDNNKVGKIEGIIEKLTGYDGLAFFSGTTQENQEILNKLKIVKQKETTGKDVDSSSTAMRKSFKQYVAISNLPELKNLLILCTIGFSYDKDDTDEHVEVKVDQTGYYKNHILDKDIFFIRINGQFRICRSQSDFNNLQSKYGAACIKIQ